MTFEEYVQKHLGEAGFRFEEIELVGLGWAAHRDHSSCSEIPNSSGHAKEAKGRIEGDKSGYGRIADPALEGDPFTWVFTDVNGKAKELAGDPVHRSPQDLRIYTALYTHPVSRQALEGEPVAVVDRVGIMQRLSPYTNLPEGTKLYTHPVSDVPDAEYIRALQDAFDIIQADANTEQNYWFLCRIGRVLAKLKAKQEQGQ